MDASAITVLLDSIRLINANLEKLSARLDIIENDFRERSIKKKLMRWLVTFYPVVMIMLMFMIDSDHHKIAEITGDVKELISDTHDLATGNYVMLDN